MQTRGKTRSGWMEFDLSWISKYRVQLMGMCAIGVILAHADMVCNLPSVLSSLCARGNLGVDIFLFLSGIGMYYSLHKESDKKVNLGQWYIKRYERILIPYFLTAIPLYIWYCIVNQYGISNTWYYVSTASFWVEHIGFWYIDLLIPLYLVTPVFAKIIDNSRYRMVSTAIIMLIAMVLSILQFPKNQGILYSVIENVQFVLERVPLYFLGYGVGKYVKEKRKVSIFHIFTLMAVFLLMQKIPGIRRMYRGGIIGLIFMAIFCCLIQVISEKSWVNRALSWLGERSLESYVTNAVAVPVFQSFDWRIGGMDLSYGNYVCYLFIIVVGIALIIPVHWLTQCLLKKLRQKKM